MTGIWGWIKFDKSGTENARDLLQRMPNLGAAAADKLTYLIGDNVAFAGPADNTYVYKKDLLSIGVFSPSFTSRSPADDNLLQNIASEYLRKGELAIQLLHGSFLVVLVDEKINQAFVAVDRLGMRNLLFYHTESCLVFGPVR